MEGFQGHIRAFRNAGFYRIDLKDFNQIIYFQNILCGKFGNYNAFSGDKRKQAFMGQLLQRVPDGGTAHIVDVAQLAFHHYGAFFVRIIKDIFLYLMIGLGLFALCRLF